MKRMAYSLVTARLGWNWHLHLLQLDEDSLQILPALESKRSPRLWNGSQSIPMKLVALRLFLETSADSLDPLMDGRVPVANPDGTEWKHILEWSASGGLNQLLAGPPRTNPRMHRIVSKELRAAIEVFNLPPHQFYPVNVQHEFTQKIRTYYLFHLLADQFTEKESAFWPMQQFQVIHNLTGEILHRFSIGSVQDIETARIRYQTYVGEKGLAFLEARLDHPYFIYRQPYDLVWGDGWMALSEEMGTALLAEFGPEYIGTWTGKPTITGFDPEVDVVPEELLNL
jgi:hypothetical protein